MIFRVFFGVLAIYSWGILGAQPTVKDVETHYEQGIESAKKYKAAEEEITKGKYLNRTFNAFREILVLYPSLKREEQCKCADKIYRIGYDIQVKRLPLDSAIQYYAVAANAYQACDTINKAKVIGSYANQGRLLRRLYRLGEGQKIFQDFATQENYLEEITTEQEKSFAAYFYYEWAKLEELIGDLKKAEQNYVSAITLYDQIRSMSKKASSIISLGGIYNQLNKSDQSIALIKNLLPTLTSDALGVSEKNAQSKIISANIILGSSYLRTNNLEGAYETYTKLLEENISELNKVVIINNLGIITRKMGDYPAAQAYLSSAIETSQDEKLPFLSDHFNNMGDIFMDLDREEEALSYYQQALNIVTDTLITDYSQNLPLDILSASQDKTGLITFLTSKAKALFTLFQKSHSPEYLASSQKSFDLAIDLIDQLRKDLFNSDSKLFLLNEAMNTYEGAIAAALSAGDVARAFQISEKSKSTLLYTAMRGQQAKSYAQIPEDLLEEEYFLNEEIAYLEHQLSARADETELITRLTIAKTQLEQLVKKIETAYPEYYRLKYDTQPIDLGFLQESLPEQTYLVEFFTGKDSTYIFVIDKGRVQVEHVASREADVQAWVQQLHDNRLEENFYFTGHALYQDFFQSFDLEVGHHLLIVPDGQLNYLPFGALLSHPVTAGQGPSQYDYLIQRHPISYSFSAKLWQWTTQQEKSFAPFQKNLLVFAPDFQKVAPAGLSAEDQGYLYDPFFGGRPTVQTEAALSPLRVLKTGASNLANELNGNFYPNEEQDALLGRFIDIAKQYRIIHLTTHGSSNKDNNRYSYLAFRPTEDSIDNERLYLADLYRLELNADMVVLAACETNLGELHPGEGNASLAQGFTYAGARSIVATLWQVNEASTSDLMQAFYQYLQEGKDKATALQLAKQDLIANAGDYPTPYYWAAPIVIGDTEPIDFRPMWIPYVMIGGFVLLLVLMIGILRRRRT